MRPSGRKARRQGRVKVVTVVIVKGRLVSDFCSPALTWAQAAADARVSSNVAFANCIVISPLLLKLPILRDPGALLPIVYDGRDHDKISGNSELRTLAGQKRPIRVLIHAANSCVNN